MIIVDNYAIELLTQSYAHYKKTNSLDFKFSMYNADDFFFYTEAAKQLAEENYIEAISDNIFADNLNLFNNVLKFKLLNKGISYVENLK